MRGIALAVALIRPAPLLAPAVPFVSPVRMPQLALPALPSPALRPVLPSLRPLLAAPPALPVGRVVAADAPGDAAVLAGLRRAPPKAVVMDYDNTLTERGPDGLSLQPSEEVTAAVAGLLASGVKVVLASSRYYESPGTPFPFDMAPFIARLPAELRRNLLVSGGVGSELVAFDEAGAPLRLWSQGWSAGEGEALGAAARAAAADVGVREDELQLVVVPGQLVARLPAGDQRGPALAEALRARLAAAGASYRVLQNKEFVYFSRSDKGVGVREALAALGGRLREADVLLLGDEFGLPDGGDAAMALAFPRARAVSVGDAHARRLPRNVHVLGERAGRGALLVLRAVLDGILGR
ncbi:hypothetical protein EPO15_13720 [bacterium]|nr:MAG: hypothetical protein EPO15_13720 [bacterium]